MLNKIGIFSILLFIGYQAIYSKIAPDYSVAWMNWFYILLYGSIATLLLSKYKKSKSILQVLIRYSIVFFYVLSLRYVYLLIEDYGYTAYYHSNSDLLWWEFKMIFPAVVVSFTYLFEEWKHKQ